MEFSKPLPAGLRPKNLLLIPSRFALAAQADGWIVRADIVWAKGVSFLKDYAGSSMPESVQDRPSRSHENVYLLAKQERYFWDRVAVAEPHIFGSGGWQSRYLKGKALLSESSITRQSPYLQNGGAMVNDGHTYDPVGRNLRSVWVISPRPFSAAHFACWPEALVDPMIRATTSERGCCPACGASWVRVVEKTTMVIPERQQSDRVGVEATTMVNDGARRRAMNGKAWAETASSTTTGWSPICTCDAGAPMPCTVLDPFSGSGTTGKVAVRLGRRYIGVDLADEYLNDVTDARMGDGVQMELVGA